MAFHADSTELDNKEILTWEGFGAASRELAQQIVDSEFVPDIIIAVARGGLLPAGALSYAMGVKLSDAVNVEFYTDVHETLPDPVLLAPMLDTDSISDKKVLVVDDVVDSGRTLSLVCWSCCAAMAPSAAPPWSTRSPARRSVRTSPGSPRTSGLSSRGPRRSR